MVAMVGEVCERKEVGIDDDSEWPLICVQMHVTRVLPDGATSVDQRTNKPCLRNTGSI